MLEYRLYLLDRDGHVCRGEEFVSENDEAAMATARAKSSGQTAEVWQYARVVGKITGFSNAPA
jgi:hypothetical protein